MRFILSPLAVVMLAASASSAPALKSNTIDGELRILGGSDPVVIRKERMPEGDFADRTYWLVFTNSDTQGDTIKIGEGPVVVKGTVSRGGQYWYVIVENVTSAKD